MTFRGDSLGFERAKFSSSGSSNINSGSVSYTYYPQPSIGLEVQFLPLESWGFIGGIDYELQRKLQYGSVTVEGLSTNFMGTSGSHQVQFTRISARAVYRQRKFYMPVGFNYIFVKFTPADGFLGITSFGGELESQFGAGWIFSETVTLEFQFRLNSMKLKSTATSGAITRTTDYGVGRIATSKLALKFNF